MLQGSRIRIHALEILSKIKDGTVTIVTPLVSSFLFLGGEYYGKGL